jgi:cell division protein FtsQ
MPRVSRPRAAAPRPTAFVQDRYVQDRPSASRMFWRRVRRSFTQLAVGAVLIGGLAIGGGAFRQYAEGQTLRERLGNATAPLGLRVHQVVVEGRQKTPEPLLRDAIAAADGQPILGYSVTEARARIETIRWVQNATVARRLPDTIVVTLNERRPFAVWQHEGKFVLIDRDGQLVTDSDVGTFSAELPLVVGEGAPAAAAALLDALAVQPAIQSRVQAAVRVGNRRWNLRLANGMDVLLPEGAEVAALARLALLQSTQAMLDRPLQMLDLRLPDRLVYRTQPGRAPDPKDLQPPPARKPT